VEEFAATLGPGTTASQANQVMMINVSQLGQGGNLNLSQPFYQTMVYGPKISPMWSDMPHGHVPNVLFPRTSSPNTHQIGFMAGECPKKLGIKSPGL
jgi:hypothetical protein